MAEFDISYTTSYQSAIVTIALSCTIFELFDMKECRDFEGHSKSVADTHTSSYSHSIITIVSKIERYIGRQSRFFIRHST